MEGGLSGQLTELQICRYPATKGRCHGNLFWDYISYEWPLARDNDMGISCKGWLIFNQSLCLLVAVSAFVVVAVGTAPGGRGTGWELTR